MTVNTIIEVLTKLTEFHQNLNILARDKTEIVKKGDVPSLQSLLKEENKQLKEIRKEEVILIEQAHDFLQEKGINTEQTSLSAVIKLADKKDKEVLQKSKQILENEIDKLKVQNKLNQELLAQSLQFVQMSLEILQPDIDSYNYDQKEPQNKEQRPNRSIFDSRA